MSDNLHSQDEDVPRLEPWLGVMASALVPLIVALYVHSRFHVALMTVTVLLFIAGLVMLRGQTVRRRIAREQHPPPAGR